MAKKQNLPKEIIEVETVLQVSEISGGITNLLWKLSHTAGDSTSAVVVRVFGKQTDIIIDRAREEVALEALNRGGFGAQVRVI